MTIDQAGPNNEPTADMTLCMTMDGELKYNTPEDREWIAQQPDDAVCVVAMGTNDQGEVNFAHVLTYAALRSGLDRIDRRVQSGTDRPIRAPHVFADQPSEGSRIVGSEPPRPRPL